MMCKLQKGVTISHVNHVKIFSVNLMDILGLRDRIKSKLPNLVQKKLPGPDTKVTTH